ncbi:MAG TPA: hypothetical protein GX525_11195, partial [Bacilli bacterium]|nr:hypothetical protein [Bacilli bacterium]
YAAWEEKRIDRSDQSYDERKYTLHYELGLISKHEYDKTTLPIKQANFEELMARMSYILITEEIKALENGVVLTQ